MKIGLIGISFASGNKGVGALAFSALRVLNDVSIESKLDVEYVVFVKNLNNDNDSDLHLIEKYLNIAPEKVEFVLYNVKNLKSMRNYKNEVKKCDAIVDYTEGDSFTDIYGFKRFVMHTIIKNIYLKHCKCSIMAPQTYGPFNKAISRRIASRLIERTSCIFSRDKLSEVAIKGLNQNYDVNVVTDVAFALPYFKEMYQLPSDKIKVGINISRLLWVGGYTGNNQFGLTIDYKKYIYELLEYLHKSGKYQIHLISHVIGEGSSCENDYYSCCEINKQYPDTILAPKFNDPIEAKSYISNLDVLIGARMHATIAAFSSGVATIPVAYSRKFRGLYSNIGYDYMVDGSEDSTEEALKKTIAYIEDSEQIRKDGEIGLNNANNLLQKYKCKLKEVLKSIK